MGRGGAAAGEPEVYSICTFFAKSGNCRNGTSCQFAHVVNAFACVPASTLPIKTISLAEIGGEMKLLTGGVEPTIKVWNFTTGQVVMQTSLATAGPVEHIEVSGSYITWSVEEAIPECAPGDPNVLSGTVYMQDQTSNSTTTITVCRVVLSCLVVSYRTMPCHVMSSSSARCYAAVDAVERTTVRA